jgi:hypothetical protein
MSLVWEVRSFILLPLAGCIYIFSEGAAIFILVVWSVLVN